MNDEVVISRYTDEQAVDDGVLVRLNARDRVTRAVWDFLVEHQPAGPKPPDCWPVDLFAWFGAKKPTMPDDPVAARMYRDIRAKAMATGLIGAHGQAARRVYEQNIGGGIWKGYALVGRFNALDRFARDLPEKRILERDVLSPTTLWLIPNEQGGLTLLFPEDN